MSSRLLVETESENRIRRICPGTVPRRRGTAGLPPPDPGRSHTYRGTDGDRL